MTLTAWATMSWSSRAIRARSSATAMRAAASRSRSAWIARVLRGLGLLGALAQREACDPGDPELDGNEDELCGRVAGDVVDDAPHRRATTSTKPIHACLASRRFPSRTAEAKPDEEQAPMKGSAGRR